MPYVTTSSLSSACRSGGPHAHTYEDLRKRIGMAEWVAVVGDRLQDGAARLVYLQPTVGVVVAQIRSEGQHRLLRPAFVAGLSDIEGAKNSAANARIAQDMVG